MRGLYRVYKDNQLVLEQPNILTTEGKKAIIEYLAGTNPSWASTLVVGSGATAPTVNDSRLAFEYARTEIELRQPDVAANRVLFRGALAQQTSGVIYETGLYSQNLPVTARYVSSRIADFDSNLNQITGGTADAGFSRTSQYARRVNAAAGVTETVSILGVVLDLSGYQNSDTMRLAAHIVDANTASIEVRLLVDASNYFRYTISPGTTTGYRIFEWTKGSMLTTGAPTWNAITQVDVRVTAGAGATVVHLDGLRVEDLDNTYDTVLVSRTILGTPISKTFNEQVDIEYVLEFTL